jgi:acyl-CoA synthetase (AMP-forming)/AMP-acid ligase II
MYAGSAINATLLKRALAEFGCEFMQFYGATESGGAMSILRPEQHDLNDESKLKSCGTPMPLCDFRIVGGERQGPARRRDRRVRRALAGALHGLSQPAGADGFGAEPGLVQDRRRRLPRPEGRSLLHRRPGQGHDRQRRGERLFRRGRAGDPEASRRRDVGRRGRARPKWGERVTAVVVLKPGTQLTAEELVAHCRQHIAGYKVPKQVEFETSLPISPAGKILKRLVRDRFWEGQSRGVA